MKVNGLQVPDEVTNELRAFIRETKAKATWEVTDAGT